MFEGMMEDSRKKIRYSTGTWLDIQTGKYEFGYGGGLFLNGGLGTCTTGLHGRGNTYKSTVVDSWIMAMMRLYPQMICFIFDTEFSKERARLLKFSRGVRCGTDDESLSKRVVLKSDPSWTIEKITKEINKIAEERKKNAKDLMITTPFFDHLGKPVKVMLPTVVYIDSWSELTSDKVVGFLEEKGLSDDKFRTLYMENGNKKTLLLTHLNQVANESGIIICATARTGNNMSMDHMPPAKEFVHQKQKDKIKDVGSKFTTLVHVLTQITSCRPCQHTDKTAMYPFGDTGPLDLNVLTINSSRNKSNMSGPELPLIVSQEYGLLNEVTYFHFLREFGNGVMGRAPNYRNPWLPDVVFSRKDLRINILNDYAFCRALEFTAKYSYIKQSWNTSSLPVNFDLPVEKVFDVLNSNNVDMKEVLQSTSAWAPIPTGKKVKPGEVLGAGGRRHMSLFEVLQMVETVSAAKVA